MTHPQNPDAIAPAIRARGLTLDGDRGRILGPLDFDIPRGGLHLVRGAAGTGRTCLALTLAGRLKPTAGDLEVAGRTGHRRILATVDIAGFREIDPLDPALRVRDLLTEKARWDAPWYRRVPRVDEAHRDAICAPAFGPHPAPDLSAHVGDLRELDRMLLRIALAEHPDSEVLVIDDLGQVRLDGERAFLAHRLADIGRRKTVIAFSINDLPDGAPAHTVHPLLAHHPVTDPATGITTDTGATTHATTHTEEVRP